MLRPTPPRAANSLLLLAPLFRPLPERCAFMRRGVASSVCLVDRRVSTQAPGTGFPRRHAAPSAQSDYRSLSEVAYSRRRIGTSDSQLFRTCTMPLMTRRVVRPLDAPYIRRQMRFDPLPIARRSAKTGSCAQSRSPSNNELGIRIVRAKKLMSSDPSHCREYPKTSR